MIDRGLDRINSIRDLMPDKNRLVLAYNYQDKRRKELSVETTPTTILSRVPSIPLPDNFTLDQEDGHQKTKALYDQCFHTGEGFQIYDGFQFVADTDKDVFTVLCDSKNDPFLIGIIEKAKEFKSENPSLKKLLFEIGLLYFGTKKQQRHPLNSLKTGGEKQTGIYLGELIWTTNVEDLDCKMMAFAMQIVGQALDLDMKTHVGEVVRLSPYCYGGGMHAWNTIYDENGDKRIVDWTNYPPSLNQIFESFQTESVDNLDNRFSKIHFGFPHFVRESHPPPIDADIDLNPIYLTRDSSVYRAFNGDYLGTSRMTGGWDFESIY